MILDKDTSENFLTYIKILATSTFIDQESSHVENRYIWSYHVRIENNSQQTLQLWRRHWKIIDSFGKNYEVVGEGVIGEQPILQPGDVFEYTSATSLSAPSGIMKGFYDMKDLQDQGATFQVSIPVFSLDSPYEMRAIN